MSFDNNVLLWVCFSLIKCFMWAWVFQGHHILFCVLLCSPLCFFSATCVPFLFLSGILTMKALSVVFSLSPNLHISLVWGMPCTRCAASPGLLVMWQCFGACSSFFVSLRCQLNVLPKYERIGLSNTGVSDLYFHSCPQITTPGCPGEFCTLCSGQIWFDASNAAVWF